MIRFFLVLTFCVAAFSAFADEPAQDVAVPVPAHDIARGAVIAESDLVYKNIPAMQVNASVLKGIADAVGLETRRSFRAGEILRAADLKHPTLVAKGSTVTMLFEAPGISLAGQGRAMGEGAMGDTISILNPVSYRQVQATVIAPGQVRVGLALSETASQPAVSRLASAQQ